MRKTVTLLSLLFISAASSAQMNMYSVIHMNENDDYKTVKPTQITEVLKSYSSGKTIIDKNIKAFDGSGMLLTESRYDGDDKLTVQLSYINDTVHRIVTSRVYENWGPVVHTKEVTTYIYDVNYFLTEVDDKTDAGKLYAKTEIKNNEKGLPVELAAYDGAGGLYGTETAEYLYDINKVKTSVISNSGQLVSTDTLTLNFKNRAAFKDGFSVYNSNGDATRYRDKKLEGGYNILEVDYKYDAKGNCISAITYQVEQKSNGKERRKLLRSLTKEYTY